ncbi:MAG: alpha/beta fold hydrolase [Azospirillaceae bacterium]|nr:alpha/beta fold hydrolase [Azospirillaceae bacterium]
MKRSRLLLGLMLMLTLATVSQARAADTAGVQQMSLPSPARGKPLSVTLWYPAGAGGHETLVGDSKLFTGTPARADAPIAGGRHPLIVLSHGSGARVETMAWLAASLAEAGFIVAGPNHPGTTSGDSTPEDTPKLWQRTDDLSTTITALTGDSRWSAAIDATRIAVLGFSLGGAAALDLAGGRVRLDAYVRYCDGNPAMADCVWFAGRKGFVDGEAISTAPFDLRTVDRARFEQSNRDARIVFAVLVDPSMAQAFDPQSLKDIAIPLLFINQGRADAVPVSVKADALTDQSRNARLIHVPDAVHFSFLPECKPGGAALLKSLGDGDTLCDDAGTRSRADIHAELRQHITTALVEALKPDL